jgi:hypothetical protein
MMTITTAPTVDTVVAMAPRTGATVAINGNESAVDYVEVGRTSHQLTVDHGRSAYLYADKLMLEATAGGKVDEAAFWKAVSAAPTPR